MRLTKKIICHYKEVILFCSLVSNLLFIRIVFSRPVVTNISKTTSFENVVFTKHTTRLLATRKNVETQENNERTSKLYIKSTSENTAKFSSIRIVKFNNQARIINGHTSTKGRYPYIVSLTYMGSHVCGGTLIAPDIVLSAAHCAKSFDGVLIGKHNTKDKTESNEHFIFEECRSHPKYEEDNGIQLNNDFLIIKLFGISSHSIAKINGNPNIPRNEGDSLTVMGWGVINSKTSEMATELQEVEVKYISNENCKKVSGYVKGHNEPISLKHSITDSMICAKDHQEDACQGDSGGPLIVTGSPAQGAGDLLVGVVSWGIGCAHEHFPGIYARVSKQIGWINKMVCDYSEDPPPDLKKWCPSDETQPSEEIKDTQEKEKVNDPMNVLSLDLLSNIENNAEDFESSSELSTSSSNLLHKTLQQPITIVIKLDRYAQETGWLLRLISGSKKKTLMFAPIGTYKGKANEQIVQEIFLDVDNDYEFIMLDSYGDGMAFDNPSYTIYRGSGMKGPILVHSDGKYAHSIKHKFSFPHFNTETPTTSPIAIFEPTISPTPGPTKKRASIIVELKFDKFPEETSWAVSCSDDGVLMGVQQAGVYSGQTHELVTERVWLYGPEHGTRQYAFGIFDEGNNGLCCDEGPGYYSVYLDEISDDALLFSGDIFTDVEQFSFVIEWNSEAPSQSPYNIQLPTRLMTSEPTDSSFKMGEKISLDILRPIKQEPESTSGKILPGLDDMMDISKPGKPRIGPRNYGTSTSTEKISHRSHSFFALIIMSAIIYFF